MSTAARPSCSASSWSPSTPNASRARSTSPTRSNTSATNASCESVSRASNASVSTLVAPAARSSSAAACNDCGSRAANTTVRARRCTSSRTVASAMSEPPPSTSTDCTDPSASFMSSLSSHREVASLLREEHVRTTQPWRGGWSGEAEAALEVGLEQAGGVDAGAQLGEAVEVGVHDREQLGAQARVLGQVDAAADVGDELVEPVEELRQPGDGARDVERERPPGLRERQRSGVAGTEALEHGEERRRPRLAEHLDRPAHRVVRVVGHDVLVLQEAAAAVEPVPVLHAVERVEERRD